MQVFISLLFYCSNNRIIWRPKCNWIKILEGPIFLQYLTFWVVCSILGAFSETDPIDLYFKYILEAVRTTLGIALAARYVILEPFWHAYWFIFNTILLAEWYLKSCFHFWKFIFQAHSDCSLKCLHNEKWQMKSTISKSLNICAGFH